MADFSLIKGLGDYLKIDSVGLTSDRFYNTLNHNEDNLDDYESECESLLSEKRHFKYNRLCKKLLRYLKTSLPISDKKDSAYNDCILFNYWIYNEIARRNKYNYRSKVIPAFGELQDIWNGLIETESNSHYFKKCEPDFNLPQQDDWEKRKQLYDYCVNYESLSRTANLFQNSCKYIYRYIKSNAPLYDYFNKRCIQGSKYNCPDFYSKCKNYDPNIVLQKLDCYHVVKKEESSHPLPAGDLSVNALQDMSSSRTFSPDSPHLIRDGTDPVEKTGNILLGVVATSLTSGALYRVNIK
ncbi:unnamed protein product [Plasmodium vivax]|uniref:(malaria parasite P. vivax) hypothetical protein n=1 Tax=Plasmodium vivax TaxID=5855 RepID=A0A8S4HIN9_PLAVI|nr:unnamed protein product [Plasmodium vivax]